MINKEYTMKHKISKLLAVAFYMTALTMQTEACNTGSGYTIESTVFSDHGWHQPVSGTLTTSTAYDYDSDIYRCNFGFRHGGVDILAARGTTVYAIDYGKVLNIVEVTGDTLNTSRIYIQHNGEDGNFTVTYGHVVASSTLEVGDTVTKGESIGTVVRYGSPDHVHFEVRDSDDDSTIDDATFGSIKGDIVNPINYLAAHNNKLTRAEAIGYILDKFNISTQNSGFNQSIFAQLINTPNDVDNTTTNYDYIVTAYNRGIASGVNTTFRPDQDISLAEFIIMISRTIPIPLDNPDYKEYNYSRDAWYYKYAKAAYNAGIISNQSYTFTEGISEETANALLDSAYDYFRGSKSGISIYANWTKKYADIDLYLFDKKSVDNIEMEHTDYEISNMSALRNSGGVVYWSNHSSSWGANLDYDSWGANGNQPWAGFGEERITVDSLMVRRPGIYYIILCYYDWNITDNPDDAKVEWWGINAGKNINTGGQNFVNTIKKGTCMYVGTLNTN